MGGPARVPTQEWDPLRQDPTPRPSPKNYGFSGSNVSPGWVGSAPPDPPGTHGPTRPLSSASPDRNYIISRLSDCRSSVYEGNWRNISCDRSCDRSCDSNMRSDPLTRKPLCDQASLESVHLNAQEHTSLVKMFSLDAGARRVVCLGDPPDRAFPRSPKTTVQLSAPTALAPWPGVLMATKAGMSRLA